MPRRSLRLQKDSNKTLKEAEVVKSEFFFLYFINVSLATNGISGLFEQNLGFTVNLILLCNNSAL